MERDHLYNDAKEGKWEVIKAGLPVRQDILPESGKLLQALYSNTLRIRFTYRMSMLIIIRYLPLQVSSISWEISATTSGSVSEALIENSRSNSSMISCPFSGISLGLTERLGGEQVLARG